MSYFDEVDCPYCGHSHDMSEYEFDGNDEIDVECENEECEKEFEVIREWSPSYGSVEIVYEKCEGCNRDTREPKVDEVTKETLCSNCYFKRYMERLKNL